MIREINHITIATKDVSKSFDFYVNTLGFKPLCKWDKGAYLLVGNTWFCINYDETTTSTQDYTHIAFDVTQDNFETIKSKIITSNVMIFKDNISERDSLYFCDPDGHKLEIHVGNWQTRVASKKNNPGSWLNVEFFV
ncbi:MAG: fosA [Burkholderiales bacterium]|jgi:catechol 2,3-dioxygenase-like lactoylglutathione lyase family enzyme|nr:fosA [Burkholderiales bacterium]